MSTKIPTTKTAPGFTPALAIDPLAGIPLATAKAVKVPASTPVVPTTGTTNVINLAQAKKKRRATGAEFKAARDFARKTTGYDATSPIWGKKLPEVLMAVEENLQYAIDELKAGAPGNASDLIEAGLRLNRELQKRLATNAVIGSQLR